MIEYDGNTLIVYQAGYRDLTEQEQAVLDGETYWKMKDYFAKCPCPWMAG